MKLSDQRILPPFEDQPIYRSILIKRQEGYKRILMGNCNCQTNDRTEQEISQNKLLALMDETSVQRASPDQQAKKSLLNEEKVGQSSLLNPVAQDLHNKIAIVNQLPTLQHSLTSSKNQNPELKQNSPQAHPMIETKNPIKDQDPCTDTNKENENVRKPYIVIRIRTKEGLNYLKRMY